MHHTLWASCMWLSARTHGGDHGKTAVVQLLHTPQHKSRGMRQGREVKYDSLARSVRPSSPVTPGRTHPGQRTPYLIYLYNHIYIYMCIFALILSEGPTVSNVPWSACRGSRYRPSASATTHHREVTKGHKKSHRSQATPGQRSHNMSQDTCTSFKLPPTYILGAPLTLSQLQSLRLFSIPTLIP